MLPGDLSVRGHTHGPSDLLPEEGRLQGQNRAMSGDAVTYVKQETARRQWDTTAHAEPRGLLAWSYISQGTDKRHCPLD